MELSFIIVTYQREDLLQACIDSIYAQKNLPQNSEIIVIDNGGNAVVEARHAELELRLIRAEKNLGPSEGRNFGMQQARGKYWILLDDDALFRNEGVAEKIIDILNNHPDCAIVAGAGYNPAGVLETKHLPYADKAYAVSLKTLTPAPYFIGFIHGLRAKVIKEVGGYPARYFYAMSELDLSIRVQAAGYSVLYSPEVQMIHYHSPKGRPVVGDIYWHQNALNKIQIAWRFYPPIYIVSTMLIWLGASLWYTKKLSLIWRILRDFWTVLPLVRQERQAISVETVRKIRAAGGRFLY